MDGSMVLRAQWRHLANKIELVLPSAYPSPSKGQIDRFSRSYTAYGRKSLHLLFFPLKLPLPMRDLDSHLIHGSLGQPLQVLNPNGISISSAVFAGLTSATDRPTDRQTTLLAR